MLARHFGCSVVSLRHHLYLLGVALTLGFSNPVFAAQPTQLLMGGSTTLLPLSQELADGFMRQSRGVSVEVKGGGSAAGFEALIAGKVDIANSSRFISEAELQGATDAGVYPVPFRIADGCIIPIVHKSNPVRDLTLDQLQAIYSGEFSNWKEVGGIDRAINVLSRDENSGTFGVWRDLVMRDREVVAGATRRETSAEVVRTVNRGRGAIGFISLGHLSAVVKPLRVDGVMGSLPSVRSGRYPISRSLYLFTRGWPEGRTLEFINYALNPEQGQRLVKKMGFMPLYQK